MIAGLHDPSTAPPAELFEPVACILCGSEARSPHTTAQEDLTGKPGDFTFVSCGDCGLVYQHPRLPVEQIKAYYDDEYIAHRKSQSWGVLTPFFEWLMSKLDRDKEAVVRRYVSLGEDSALLDVGCGAGSFLQHMGARTGARCAGVDFKDLEAQIRQQGEQAVDFRCGTLSADMFPAGSFDAVTMWHFLEHDYDPLGSLRVARSLLKEEGRLVIEVPRLDSLTHRLYGSRWPGWQAPPSTPSPWTRPASCAWWSRPAWRWWTTSPTAPTPGTSTCTRAPPSPCARARASTWARPSTPTWPARSCSPR